MDENMELEVKRRLAQYRKCKCLGIAVWIIVAFHFLYLLFKIDSRITWLIGGYGYFILGFGLLLLTLILFVICEMIIMVGTSKISSALSMDCDPFLYEACILKSGGFWHKNRLLCNQAMAQYYQGKFELAWETFQRMEVYKLKGKFKLNYYILMSSLYFRRGMGQQVRELEEAYRKTAQNKREKKNFQILCASNNLTRALENKDYTAAFRFLQERMELNGNLSQTWTKVGFYFKEAEIYLGLGEKESARLKLEYVTEKGRRLFYVQEARQMLEGMNVR